MKCLLALTLQLVLVVPGSAQAEDTARLRLELPEHSIQGLEFDSTPDTREPEIQIGELRPDGTLPYFAHLQGRFDAQGRQLLFHSTPLSPQSDGRFEIDVPLEQDPTSFTLAVVDIEGNVQTQVSRLRFANWEEFQKNPPKEKKWNYRAGLSLYGASYYQADNVASAPVQFLELGPALTGEVRYRWKDWLRARAELQWVALPFSLSSTGQVARYLRAEAMAEHPVTRWNLSPWKLTVVASYTYRASLSSAATFGFSNIQGIALFPRVERPMWNGKTGWLALRVQPLLGGGLTFLTLPSMEIRLWGGIGTFKAWGRPLEFVLDLNWLNVAYTGGTTGSVTTLGASVGAQYVF